MGILSWIIVGLISGWLASMVIGDRQSLLRSLLVGLIGAVIGGFLFHSLLGFSYAHGLSLGSIVVATVGAMILLWLLEWTSRRR